MNVVIYRTELCRWCHKVEEFLNKHKIKHKSIDVGKDHKAAKEMIEKSGQHGVPVIDIGGKIIVGFAEPKLREALGIK